LDRSLTDKKEERKRKLDFFKDGGGEKLEKNKGKKKKRGNIGRKMGGLPDSSIGFGFKKKKSPEL